MQVSGKPRRMEVVLSLDTNIYASGDVLAATQEIPEAMLTNGGVGMPLAVRILDEDDQGADFDILFLKSNQDIGTENAAFAISDAEAREILGWIDVAGADMTDWGGYQDVTYTPQNTSNWHVGFVQAAGDSRSIFIAAIARGTPTHTASGIRIYIDLAF